MTIDIELWRAAPGFEGSYEVSSHGRVRSLLRVDSGGNLRQPQMISLQTAPDGGIRVRLQKEGKGYNIWLGRLVLGAFVGAGQEGDIAHHIDGDKKNNNLSNLEWMALAEHTRGRFTGVVSQNGRKTHCKMGHPYDEANTIFYRKGKGVGRSCRECKHKRHTRPRTALSSAPLVPPVSAPVAPAKLEGEHWLPIADTKGVYEISDFGRVRSHRRGGGEGSIMRFSTKGSRRMALRPVVGMSLDGRVHHRYVDELVVRTFQAAPDGRIVLSYADGDPTNARLSNLSWRLPTPPLSEFVSLDESEIWKVIPSLNGLYSVSSWGRVRCHERRASNGRDDTGRVIGEKIVAVDTRDDTVRIAAFGQKKTRKVVDLMMESFAIEEVSLYISDADFIDDLLNKSLHLTPSQYDKLVDVVFDLDFLSTDRFAALDIYSVIPWTVEARRVAMEAARDVISGDASLAEVVERYEGGGTLDDVLLAIFASFGGAFAYSALGFSPEEAARDSGLPASNVSSIYALEL
ncbi:HNH homing endonuclease [Rathayibacter phage NCPPB3778]|nr:HNH homing endonuclease [Rathayibacter phage NCPPB3778]